MSSTKFHYENIQCQNFSFLQLLLEYIGNGGRLIRHLYSCVFQRKESPGRITPSTFFTLLRVSYMPILIPLSPAVVLCPQEMWICVRRQKLSAPPFPAIIS